MPRTKYGNAEVKCRESEIASVGCNHAALLLDICLAHSVGL